MRLFPIWLLSKARGGGGELIRRAQRRFHVVVTPSISQVEKQEDKVKASLVINKTGVLQVLTSLKEHPYRALTFLKRIETNSASSVSVQAYVTVIRILCNCSSCGLEKKLDELLVELIRKGDEGCGFSVRDLLDVIEEEEGEEVVLSRLCGSLVKAYANLNMFGKAIDTYCYCSLRCTRSLNVLISRMIACGEHGTVLSLFRTYGFVVSDEDTRLLLVKAYRKVVIGLCDEMKMEKAEVLVVDMEENHGIGEDVCVYSAIIEGHRKRMNFPRALQFFDDVVVGKKGKRRKINRVIASSVLDCCCHMGEFEEAYYLFKQFRDSKVSLDRVCYNVAFDALVKLGKTQEAVELFRGMTRQGIAPDVVNYTTLISGCCLHGEVEQAHDLVNEMERGGKTPDAVTYNVLAGGYARNGDVENVDRTLELMESRGVQPTSVTYNMVIQGLAVAGKTHEADAYYDKSPGNDASFIKGYCESGRLDEAFERFKRLDFPLPKNVYFILVNSLCASDDHIYKAQLVLNRMYNLGVEPGKNMHGIMISAWCRVRKVENALRNFRALLNREIIPDKYTYTTMINSYCLMKLYDEALFLFQDMKKRRIIPDLATYTMIQDHYPDLHTKSELEARGIELDVHYHTVMVDRQCKTGDVQNAEYIFRHMIESAVEPDDVAYAALISGWCKNKCEDKAQELIHEMVGKGMTPPKACVDTYVKLIGEMVKHGMAPYEACEDLYVLIQEMVEKGMQPHEACMDLYVKLIGEMVVNGMAPAKACEELYLLIHEMLEKGMTPHEACKDLYAILIREMVGKEMTVPEEWRYLYVILIPEMVEKGMELFKACKEVYVTLIEEIVRHGMTLPEACKELYVTLIREMVEEGLRPPKACLDLFAKFTVRDSGKWMT